MNKNLDNVFMAKQFLKKNISEKITEKICKNIAIALHISNIAYYETKDWIEITYDKQCI